jgi:8-oxo-dGTP pyrophosphatase MutT (NUDIX family)
MDPAPAATVILLRHPYEVLMVRRNPDLAFMGGFWVFPGGRVDAADHGSPEQAARRELTEEAAIRLRPGAELIPFARWITPLGLPRRFDTYFFLADATGAVDTETATVDGTEIVAARWVAPGTVLEDGSELAFPTRTQLERLAGFTDTTSLITATRGLTITPILPTIVHNDGRRAVVVPEA